MVRARLTLECNRNCALNVSGAVPCAAFLTLRMPSIGIKNPQYPEKPEVMFLRPLEGILGPRETTLWSHPEGTGLACTAGSGSLG